MEPVTTLEALRQELSGRGAVGDGRGQSSEAVFRRLLQAIVSLEVAPGVMLAERELMDLGDCSRAALRPAVIRLAELGLLRALPRKGLVVAPLDSLDASAIYEARWAIESHVARLAAVHARPEQVASLEALQQENGDSANGTGWRTFLERDQALHLSIASMAGNQYLFDGLTRILPLGARLWHWVYGQLHAGDHVRFEHDDIVAAIRERDPDAAERAAVAHVQEARDLLSDVFISRLQGGAR